MANNEIGEVLKNKPHDGGEELGFKIKEEFVNGEKVDINKGEVKEHGKSRVLD